MASLVKRIFSLGVQTDAQAVSAIAFFGGNVFFVQHLSEFFGGNTESSVTVSRVPETKSLMEIRG